MEKIKLKFMSLTRLSGLKDGGVGRSPFLFVIPVLLFVMSVACHKESGPNIIEATSVSLNKTSVSLAVGGTVELTATVFPEDATDKTVTWLSSNTGVATVTNGKVTAVSVGTATITAQSGSVKTECYVTVRAINVTSVKLNKTSVSLAVGEKAELTATVLPENATDKTVVWSSSDESVATVSNGKVIAVGVGSATITAQSREFKAECKVIVLSIQLYPTAVTLVLGDSVELVASVFPWDFGDAVVEWLSSNTDVATVVDGKVKAVGAGNATVTVQVEDIKAECAVTVIIEVASIKLNKASVVLSLGSSVELTATVLPENATDKTVAWSSSDASVATVANGKVTAVGVGSAAITARTSNGCSVECIIVVKDKKDDDVPPGGSEGTGEVEW